MSSDAGSFWNLSKSNMVQKSDFFATRDVTKTPLSEISFANNVKKTESVNTKSKENTKTSDEGKDEEYCLELVALNKSILDWIKTHVEKNPCIDWIKTHVEKNPCIDLTPVVRDYEKHLTTIGENYNTRSQVDQTKVFKTPEPANPSSVTSLEGKKDSVSFVASTPINDNAQSNTNKFQPGFFTPCQPTIVEKPAAEAANEVKESEPDDNPPVVEKKTIVEDDAFYQIRSKLFFKKGSSWQELGVGMLYLKPAGEKIQLLIRMEAVTGKILLNVNISKDVPVSRSGKNNLMVVTLPNPPVYAKPADGDNSVPCTYLIRVKGTTEADELYSKLKQES